MDTQRSDGGTTPIATPAQGSGATFTVELSPARVESEPGGTPVEIVVTLQNLSNVVEQYTLEVTGIDADWYTAPVASVSLFPLDTDRVRLSVHPPKRPGLRAGSYPFTVVARSRGAAGQVSAQGILDVRGAAVYRLVDLTPRRLTARGRGTFRLQIANTGAADVRLGLEGHDAEDACTFRFARSGEPMVAANSKVELPVVVRPKKRPWIGPERSYDFTVSARPLDARGEPQTVAAQFTHKPLIRAFRIWPFVKWALIGLAVLLVLVVLFALGVPQEFGRRAEIATAQACGGLRGVPVIGGACPHPSQLPVADANCTYQYGFKDFADAEAEMVGACKTNVVYDEFGNGLQYSKKGVLFWLKESNTVYFFNGDSLWAYVAGKPRLLDGSGRPS